MLIGRVDNENEIYKKTFKIFISILVLTGCNNDRNKLNYDDNNELIQNSYHAYSKNECIPSNEV